MEMTTDAHFVIGGLHIRQNMPCQDHTRCGGTPETAFISLSDGCSTGGETDTGARIMNTAAAIVIQNYLATTTVDPHESAVLFAEKIRATALITASTMQLTTRDLQATLLYAVLTTLGGFVHVFGDGGIILCFEDGTTVLYQCAWEQNTPYYLIYTGTVLEHFIDQHNADTDKSFTVTKTVIAPDGTVTPSVEGYSALEGSNGYTIAITPEMLRTLRAVVLCSDGIESFRFGNEPFETVQVVREIIAFKQWQGAFVKRRLSRMLSDFSKQTIAPIDDIAVAAIHVSS